MRTFLHNLMIVGILWVVACGGGSQQEVDAPLGAPCQRQDDCDTGALCLGGYCQTLDCAAGTLQCLGDALVTCDEAGVIDVVELCTQGCAAGECVVDCLPGTTRCDGVDVQTCNPSGDGWVTTETCATVCEQGGCLFAICTAGETTCRGNDLELCNQTGTAFVFAATCPEACAAGRCDAVLPPSVAYVSPSSGYEVGGATVQIIGVGFERGGTVQVAFGGESATQTIIASDNLILATIPAHLPGDVDVTVFNVHGVGRLDQGFTYLVLDACTANDRRCSGRDVETCNGNGIGWSYTTTCATDCDAGSCLPPVCTPAATQCNGAQLEACNASGTAYELIASCPGACNDGQCDAPFPPEIAFISPDSGIELGGTLVQITGTGFANAGVNQVSFAGVPAASVSTVNDNLIVAVTPPGLPGVVDLTVFNSHGVARLDLGFTYLVQVNCTPDQRRCVGDDVETCAVTGDAWFFTTTCSTECSAGDCLPAICAPSTTRCDGANLEVCNAKGTAYLLLATCPGACTDNQCEAPLPPGIAFLFPVEGPETGGTAVRLTGAGFSAAGLNQVSFGGTAATGVMVVDDNNLDVVTPAHAPAVVDVSVINDNGVSVLAQSFTFLDVLSCNPGDRQCAGDDVQTCAPTGDAWLYTTTCSTECAAGSCTPAVCMPGVTRCDGTELEACNSNGTAYQFIATCPGLCTDGQCQAPPPPAIAFVTPSSAMETGGAIVTLTGDGFVGGGVNQVAFGGQAATSVTIIDDNTMFVTVPVHADGIVDVTIINDNGVGRLPLGFTYLEVLSCTPGARRCTGDNVETCSAGGDAWLYTATCGVCQNGSCLPTICTPGQTRCNGNFLEACNSTGTAYQFVANCPTGCASGACMAPPPPELLFVIPATGMARGGETVTIYGTGFTSDGATRVFFGTTQAADVTYINSTLIEVTTPANFPISVNTPVNVSLLTPSGVDALPNAFTYLPQGGPGVDGIPTFAPGAQTINQTYLLKEDVAVGATFADLVTPTTPLFWPDHELLFLNVLGTGAGDWTVMTVESIEPNKPLVGYTRVHFRSSYDAASPALRYVVGTQITQVVRIPQYASVEVPVGATLEAPAFNTVTGAGGVLVFKSAGTLRVDGGLNVTGRGSHSGIGYGLGAGGTGGIGSVKTGTYTADPAGPGTPGAGGSNLSSSDLTTLLFGGAGGGGGGGGSAYSCDNNSYPSPGGRGGGSGGGGGSTYYGCCSQGSHPQYSGCGGPGGNGQAGGGSPASNGGGGILLVWAQSIIGSGAVDARGTNGQNGTSGAGAGGASGGSAGGSVRLITGSSAITPNVSGGTGATYFGTGGDATAGVVLVGP
jgi:hypothetical protein